MENTNLILVTGATGWLGKSFLEVYENSYGKESLTKKIIATASSDKYLELDSGTKIKVKKLSELNLSDLKLDGIAHFAALTRDKIHDYKIEEYVFRNMQLLSFILKSIDSNLKWFITISSGAAIKPVTNRLDFDLETNPYGFQKSIEELLLSKLSKELDFTLVIPRLWGASGKDMKSHNNYALGQFLLGAMSDERVIKIKSSHKVFRKYVDTRDLMNLCLKMVENSESGIFNSGGSLLELGDLSKEISKIIPNVKIEREIAVETKNSDDMYYPKDNEMSLLCEKYDVKLSNIHEQIKNTIKSLK